MAGIVPILVNCSCSSEHKKRMNVQCNIPLAELVTKVEAEFPCSQGIELKKKIDENNWVLLKDPLDLGDKPKLKAEKVHVQEAQKEIVKEPSDEAPLSRAMRAVESKHHLWLDRNGEPLKAIRVYFGNESPEEVLFRGEHLTADTVIALVNHHWKCDYVEDENGEQIGGHVPSFVLVEDQQYAHVMVKFYDGVKYAYMCSSTELIGSVVQNNDHLSEDEATLFLDISSKNDDKILWNILHEFGHVLGLCHEHQHPDYLKVMAEFADYDEKLYKHLRSLRKKKKYAVALFQSQYNPIQEAIFTSEYDPDSIMHYPTHLAALKNDSLKTIDDLEKMKDEISVDQYKILRGFMINVDRVHENPRPSKLDKRTVAKAYYHVSIQSESGRADPPPQPRQSPPTSHKQLSAQSSEPTTHQESAIRTKYQGKTRPDMNDLTFLNLNRDKFSLLSQISASYEDVARTLKLEQYEVDRINKIREHKDRIVEVFKHWTKNASNLAGGQYPLTWQGLWDILDDSDLTEKGKDFFAFLNRHES